MKHQSHQHQAPASPLNTVEVVESNPAGINSAKLAYEVAKKAYASFVERGSLDGHDKQDWLDAEAQLLMEHYLARKHLSSVIPQGINATTNTTIIARDLTRQAPHSPRDRLAGFVIAKRAIDKCRASVAGLCGEYHYDCPLDKKLFTFKGINGAQFKAAVQNSENYEDVGAWLLDTGVVKTPVEIKAWSDEMEASSPMESMDHRAEFIENCTKLGLNPEKSTIFDWLEDDDLESFRDKAA